MSVKRSKRNPKAWSAAKVRSVIEYYDHQTDEEAAREIENAPAVEGFALVEVPTKLLPQVRKLIAKHKKSA